MKLFRNVLVCSLFIYSFVLPSFAQEVIDLELSRLMEAEHVGESNIRTRELHTISMISEKTIVNLFYNIESASECNDADDTCYRTYEVSFLVNGQERFLVLIIEESKEHSSSEILQDVRAILGQMPARWLSEVHFIVIKRQSDPDLDQGEFKNFQIAPPGSEWCLRYCDWQERFPQLSPRVININHPYTDFAFLYNTIQVHLYYSQDGRESTDDYRAQGARIMRHELGHLIARQPGSEYSSQEWYDAIVEDETFAYGTIDSTSDDFDLEQDFAETVSIYLTTYRGFYYNGYRFSYTDAKIKYHHRFAILDRIMGIDEMKNTLNAPQEN